MCKNVELWKELFLYNSELETLRLSIFLDYLGLLPRKRMGVLEPFLPYQIEKSRPGKGTGGLLHGVH